MHDTNVTRTNDPHMFTTRELMTEAPVDIIIDDQVLTVAQVRIVADGDWAVDFTTPMEGSTSNTLHVGDTEADEPLWERA